MEGLCCSLADEQLSRTHALDSHRGSKVRYLQRYQPLLTYYKMKAHLEFALLFVLTKKVFVKVF